MRSVLKDTPQFYIKTALDLMVNQVLFFFEFNNVLNITIQNITK